MNISSGHPSVFLGERELAGFDAVIPRIAASQTFFGSAVVRQFEMMGAYALNKSVSISRSRDKLRSLQLLSRRGVGLPVTAFAHNSRAIDSIIKLAGGAPVVVKLLEGTEGIGGVFTETKKAAESVIEAYRGLDAHILVQEFIRESGGAVIRCLVVGGKVVAAMRRQGEVGDFSSNRKLGGSVKLVKITPAERFAAVQAAKIIRLNVAGVDLIRSGHGPFILGVNSSPALEGMEVTTGKDVATAIIRLIEKNVLPGKTNFEEKR